MGGRIEAGYTHTYTHVIRANNTTILQPYSPARRNKKAKGAVMGVIMIAVHKARLMSRRRAGVALSSLGSPNLVVLQVLQGCYKAVTVVLRGRYVDVTCVLRGCYVGVTKTGTYMKDTMAVSVMNTHRRVVSLSRDACEQRDDNRGRTTERGEQEATRERAAEGGSSDRAAKQRAVG
jgi:hypothetical protein